MPHRGILHIGTEKTGSTSLQSVMHANKAALLEKGFLYPTNLSAHHFLVDCVAKPHRATQSLSDSQKGEYLHSLEREIAATAASTIIVLSSELCHSRLDANEAAEMLCVLSSIGIDIDRIVVYFRDQCSLIESSYAEGINAGLQWTHSDQLTAKFYYSHKQTVERWMHAATELRKAPQISIFSYNRNRKDLPRHFLSSIGVPDVTALDLERTANARSSVAVIEATKLALNKDKALPTYAFAAWLQSLDPRPARPFLAEAFRERIEREFSNENQELCASFGLDPQDFLACDLNEPVDTTPLGVDDMVAMLIEAFRKQHRMTDPSSG